MRNIILMLLVSLLTACGNPQKTEIKILKGKVIAIHDEVMPITMKEFPVYKEKLENMAGESAQEALKKVEEADKFMMTWMNNFGDEQIKIGEKEYDKWIAFLTAELEKVKTMKKDILAAQDMAKKVIGIK